VLFLAFLALLAKAPGYRFNYHFFLFVGWLTYGAISLGDRILLSKSLSISILLTAFLH
jgi:hypothetical protein